MTGSAGVCEKPVCGEHVAATAGKVTCYECAAEQEREQSREWVEERARGRPGQSEAANPHQGPVGR
jgi:hypothetical protein